MMQSMQVGSMPQGGPMMMSNYQDAQAAAGYATGAAAMNMTAMQQYSGYGAMNTAAAGANLYAQAGFAVTGAHGLDSHAAGVMQMQVGGVRGGYTSGAMYGHQTSPIAAAQMTPTSPQSPLQGSQAGIIGKAGSGGNAKRGGNMPKTQAAKKPVILSDDEIDAAGDDAEKGEQFRHAPPADMHCPCTHNDWDDVRTRKGAKILRCRVCQSKWKLPSARVPRCSPFLSGFCERGDGCPLVHVHKRKSNLLERYEKFGDSVLRGVPAETWEKATKDEDGTAVSGSATISPEHKSFQTPNLACGEEAYIPADQQQFLPAPQQAMDPYLPPVSPTGGLGRRNSSQSMGVPSLLSTESMSRMHHSTHGHNYRMTSQLGSPHKQHASPPSLVCSPGSPTSGQTCALAGRRTFRPPQLNTGADAPPHMTTQGSACQSLEIHMSLTDSRIRGLLPSDLLSPAGAGPPDNQCVSPVHLAGVPKVDSMMMARPHLVTSPGGQLRPNATSPTHSPYAESPDETNSRQTYMREQLRVAAQAAVNMPKPQKDQQNEGVHAMTEDELDAHMERLGLSPSSSRMKSPMNNMGAAKGSVPTATTPAAEK